MKRSFILFISMIIISLTVTKTIVLGTIIIIALIVSVASFGITTNPVFAGAKEEQVVVEVTIVRFTEIDDPDLAPPVDFDPPFDLCQLFCHGDYYSRVRIGDSPAEDA